MSAGIPTGISSFDADMGGLFPGELTILAARPGVGKTSFALQVAAHNAESGRLVYFASLEMSAAELSIRLACGESGVSNRLVRIGKFGADDSQRLSEALRKQAKVALEIHDRSALTVASIRREIRKRKKRGLALAIVDYLQLVTPDDRRLPREQQVARMVRQLKETAREYEIPILCLCQLNRQADGDETPRLSHLRESGAIEQDADVVLFLSKHEPKGGETHNAILIVAKNRNGETGPLRLDWDGGRTRFSVPGHSEFAEYTQTGE
jgi:replicative DNA helicase